jgi:2-dehydropantoate 2-reductase
MRVVVAGAGALGSVVGGLLARAGHDVILLAHGAHGEALRRGPLELRLPGETVRVEVRTATSAAGDVVILTSKRSDAGAALDRVDGPAGLALSLQNGLRKNSELVARFGEQALVRGATTLAARVEAPGVVESQALGLTYVDSESWLAGALREAGLETAVVDDGAAVEWSKLAHVAGTMILQALTGLPLHELFGRPESAMLLRRITAEAAAVAEAEGVRLRDLPGLLPVATLATQSDEEAVRVLAERAAALEAAGRTDVRTSMWASIAAGRTTELEPIHGELVRHARSCGLAVPTLETCYRLAVLRGVNPPATP